MIEVDKLPRDIRRKGNLAPEGYVWVLSQNVPFYHARVLGCPRSRCHGNGRIFSLRERARMCVRKVEEEDDTVERNPSPRLARRPGSSALSTSTTNTDSRSLLRVLRVSLCSEKERERERQLGRSNIRHERLVSTAFVATTR